MARPGITCKLSCLALGIVLSSLCQGAENDALALYSQALGHYEAADFESALPLIQEAVRLAPVESRYHHLLGKCYGRIAEQANWVKAIKYATRTRESFEKAVDLDGNNLDALRDLMEYYLQAPKFLGGSATKAEAIRQKLNSLAENHVHG